MIKLGKLPAKHDPKNRTIKFKAILNEPALPPLPEEWQFKLLYPQFDLSPKMWGNDELGNCVVVASYATQRSFEVIEQEKVIDIDEGQLRAQYKKESGGEDTGFSMLDHNNVWRNEGIPIGYRKILCKKRPLMHKIDAFARINPTDIREIKYATFLVGCNIGASMPGNFLNEFNADKPWIDISLPPSPDCGHAMKVLAWLKDYLILWTWGKEQLASWDWVKKYFDEAWAMIDKINDWTGGSQLHSIKL